MKINPIRYNSITFKQKEQKELHGQPAHGFDTELSYGFEDEGTFGFSDSLSAKTRDAIREHMLLNSTPYYAYHNKPRLEEYEMNKLKESLINKKPKVYHEKLKDIRGINHFAQIEENAYRGQSLYEMPGILKVFKDAGIKTIIDAAGRGGYSENCEENGLDYKRFNFDWNETAVFHDEKDVSSGWKIQDMRKYYANEEEHRNGVRNFMDNFIDVVNSVKKGCYYIGCSLGTNRTDDAVMLIDYFNTESKLFYPIKMFGGYRIEAMKQFYKNLTENDKLRLGFTPEFEEKLVKKLGTVIHR